MKEDPERLIAQALRAHAARTPLPERTDEHTTAGLGGYGLLSGTDVGTPLAKRPFDERTEQRAGVAADPAASAQTRRLAAEPRVPAGLILLLAILLGLAAGAVVGLLTLI